MGDSVTMADLFILPQVHWSQKRQKVPVDLSLYPNLRACYQNALSDPAFVDSLPERQVGVSFDWGA